MEQITFETGFRLQHWHRQPTKRISLEILVIFKVKKIFCSHEVL